MTHHAPITSGDILAPATLAALGIFGADEVAADPQAIVDRDDMHAALAVACKVSPSRPVSSHPDLQILTHVRLTGDADGVRLAATDLDMMAAILIPGTADVFDVCVPARLLRDVVKAAPKGAILTMELRDNRLHVGGVGLDTQPASDWPGMPETDPTCWAAFDPRELRDMLQRVACAISTEETRYYLNGVYMHPAQPYGHGADGQVAFVATDGHRLARAAGGSCDPAAPGVILPRKACAILAAMMPKAKARETRADKAALAGMPMIAMDYSDTQAEFTVGAWQVRTKFIDGTFPDYERVIPRHNTHEATIDPEALRGAVKAVSAVLSARGRSIRFEFGEDTLTLTATNPDTGTATRSVPCRYEGEALEIGFNGRYVLDLLDAMDRSAETLTIRLADAGSPALFTDGEDAPGFVLMPMRV